MLTSVLVLLLLQLPLDLNGWEKITETHYEIKNVVKTPCGDIVTTSFVGSSKTLKNQELENEFVFVISKYIPFTFVPPSPCAKENSRDEIIIAENYFKKTKLEKLKEMTTNADKILIVRWEEEIDGRTGERKLDRPIKNWLLKPNGEWVFEENKKPTIKIELLSEEGILIGFKFSLGENYHILMFDQIQLRGMQ